jgi:erythromycin esterase
MRRSIFFFFVVLGGLMHAQNNPTQPLQFSSDMERFESLTPLKKVLKDVDIVALGENTHGLGDVFETKVALVKFLHKELGFNLVLFESGYGDAALAWANRENMSAEEFTQNFSSNFYYRSEEILNLVNYAKSRNGKLKLQGFDCQPQQQYLIKRMQEVIAPLDTDFAGKVPQAMVDFNRLYQHEKNGDSLAFYTQRDSFASFLKKYNQLLDGISSAGKGNLSSTKEIETIRRSNQIFLDTYGSMPFGKLMLWPQAANHRDAAMLKIVVNYKETHPEAKIIIWAQNSHIENHGKPHNPVNWMGHGLKQKYGASYYSFGTVVYSGTNQNYNGSFSFEHKDPEYLAYHLNKVGVNSFILDLRDYPKTDFTTELHLGMENNGSKAYFIAQDRFDGLLFLSHSAPPQLLNENH